MDSTMLKFLSLMTAASVAETESKDKMKGKIPKYPATAEPLSEGSSTARRAICYYSMPDGEMPRTVGYTI